MEVVEGNSREVEIVLDHATGINVSFMVMANALTATGELKQISVYKMLVVYSLDSNNWIYNYALSN